MIPHPDERKRPLVPTGEERAKFLESLVSRARSFLETEIGMSVPGAAVNPGSIEKLDLRNITSIITIEDQFRMIAAFSFEKALLDRIFKVYSQGIRIAPEEYAALLEETAGDMINIVVGNALVDFQQPGYAFNLSTPIIISEAKSILRYKNSELFTADISTNFGLLTIICITPGTNYGTKLDIEEK